MENYLKILNTIVLANEVFITPHAYFALANIYFSVVMFTPQLFFNIESSWSHLSIYLFYKTYVFYSSISAA